MLKLKELWRQLLAGLLASGGFMAAYLGANLIWWAALLIGVAVYIAALLLIERAPEDEEVFVHANLTQADVNAAVEQCKQAAQALRKASRTNRIDADTATALERMAQLVDEIAVNYGQDPRDLKHSRSFVNNHLPKMMDAVNNYVSLSERTVSEQSQTRLLHVGAKLQGYVPHLQIIHDACLENDFEKLELETSVLGDVMKLDRPRS